MFPSLLVGAVLLVAAAEAAPAILGHEDDHAIPPKYEYEYTVQDPESGNSYTHYETRDHDLTEGSYQVALPDGRRQVVRYTADKGGFNALVEYEGEATIQGPAPLRHSQRAPQSLGVTGPSPLRQESHTKLSHQPQEQITQPLSAPVQSQPQSINLGPVPPQRNFNQPQAAPVSSQTQISNLPPSQPEQQRFTPSQGNFNQPQTGFNQPQTSPALSQPQFASLNPSQSQGQFTPSRVSIGQPQQQFTQGGFNQQQTAPVSSQPQLTSLGSPQPQQPFSQPQQFAQPQPSFIQPQAASLSRSQPQQIRFPSSQESFSQRSSPRTGPQVSRLSFRP